MLQTIKHQDSGTLVVVAKLLTGYDRITSKVSDPDSYIKVHGTFEADFVAYVVTWQTNHNCTPDGIIGPDTWTAIAKVAPTCSTAKNRTSGYTMAIQLLLGGNITADAIYGPRTKAAVATYQDAHKLSVDGICGPKTWNSLIVGEEVQPQPVPGVFVQPKDFKQASKPWGPKMYSNHNDPKQTMANSGCGPTAMADIVYTLKDPSVDPWTLAQLSMQWGDRTDNSGTAWTFFRHVAEHYGFTKFVQSGNYSALTACLDAGGYVVCSMGPGYWTKGGHFICAWKYDGNYTYANDPASSTRKKQKTADFKKECKQYFCFYPDLKPALDTGSQDDANESKPANSLVRGEKICDISKYQPTVNYDAFIRDTALIILRAGYRGTGGGINKDQKFDLHAEELKKRDCPFGVYFYSIATTEDKAREEARMFYKYAKDFSPLFWAGDFEKEGITSKTICAFVDELRKLGAEKVGCYVANHLYNKYDYASIRDQMDFTWIPKYVDYSYTYGTPATTIKFSGSKPVYPCDLWQFTSQGSVCGISGNVDLNKITGQGHDLAWFTGGEGA